MGLKIGKGRHFKVSFHRLNIFPNSEKMRIRHDRLTLNSFRERLRPLLRLCGIRLSVRGYYKKYMANEALGPFIKRAIEAARALPGTHRPAGDRVLLFIRRELLAFSARPQGRRFVHFGRADQNFFYLTNSRARPKVRRRQVRRLRNMSHLLYYVASDLLAVAMAEQLAEYREVAGYVHQAPLSNISVAGAFEEIQNAVIDFHRYPV